MSLIEDAYYPLFSTTELPIDFSAAGLVPDSPGKLGLSMMRRPSFAMCNTSQAVPANTLQGLGPIDEGNLFALFMNGAEKIDMNALKGFQIPEEILMQTSMVPELRKLEQQAQLMGMDQRQYAQMGLPVSDPMINGDFNMVPQLSPNGAKQVTATDDAKGSKKRKFIQAPVKAEPVGLPAVPEGASLTPEEERNMKRQRRLVKNREAAQLFRQRQKAYIQDLEKKVSDLSATNNEFRARVELLNSENKLIKEQLLYLRNFITQAVSFSFPKSPNSEDGGSSPANLLGPLPPGLTLPPEILGAMSNMPHMALGLMGAMGGCAIPGLPGNLSEAFGFNLPNGTAISPLTPRSYATPVSPLSSPVSSPIASGSAALIPPPVSKALHISHNGMNAVVPQFSPPSPGMMVPDGADLHKVKFDAQGNMIKQAK